MRNLTFYFDTTSKYDTLIFFLPTIVLSINEHGYDSCLAWMLWQAGVKYEL